ncbi:MAG: hypothetical protein OEO77_10525 [Acidimicrobiia bacterium]|nr:hypothetical protein [Acidimicrobiia bacterium]
MKRHVILLPLLIVVAACSPGGLAPPITAVPPALSLPPQTAAPITATTTTATIPEPTTTLDDGRIDLGSARYLTARWFGDTSGLVADDGTVVTDWANEGPGSFGGVANDGHGGIAWLQGTDLWWLPAGENTPRRVPFESEFAWSVWRSPLTDDPAVSVDGKMISLIDGSALGDAHTTAITAANGLTASIVQAEVTTFVEGFIDEILAPARLVVTSESATLIDIPVGGGASEAFVTVEEFDGHTIILRRFPEEPAIPEDTHIMFDLADPDTIVVWREAMSTTALLGTADTSVPAVKAPDMTLLCPSWTGRVTSTPQVGLSDFVDETRAHLLAALQTCDFNYLGSIGRVVLGHTETPRDPSRWDPEAYLLMAEAMRLPFATVGETYVWPKWLGVDSLAGLSNSDLDLMESLYGELPADILDSPYLIPVVRIEIGKFDGWVNSVIRPLS